MDEETGGNRPMKMFSSLDRMLTYSLFFTACRRHLSVLIIATIFSACNGPAVGGEIGTGIVTLKATQYAVRFRKLPEFLGGGISNKVAPPGQMLIVWPWDRVYVLTTAIREVSWGPGRLFNEYLYTRARDGNEVALAVTVRYQLSTLPSDLVSLVQRIAVDDEAIEKIVVAVARADIRHYMNELRTAEFIDPDARRQAVAIVEEAIRSRLSKYYVQVVAVILEDSKFERALPNGEKDDTYQEKLDEIQRIFQETSREVSRVATVIALKEGVYNDEQAKVNRLVEEAKGTKEQARIRGDNYLKSRGNEAKGILAQGQNEAEGIQAQTASLAGPGGRQILRLDVAKRLAENHSKFVVVDSGQASGLAVSRLDANELMSAMGALEGAVKSPPIIKSPTTEQR